MKETPAELWCWNFTDNAMPPHHANGQAMILVGIRCVR
jgi:hypothetical protein